MLHLSAGRQLLSTVSHSAVVSRLSWIPAFPNLVVLIYILSSSGNQRSRRPSGWVGSYLYYIIWWALFINSCLLSWLELAEVGCSGITQLYRCRSSLQKIPILSPKPLISPCCRTRRSTTVIQALPWSRPRVQDILTPGVAGCKALCGNLCLVVFSADFDVRFANR